MYLDIPWNFNLSFLAHFYFYVSIYWQNSRVLLIYLYSVITKTKINDNLNHFVLEWAYEFCCHISNYLVCLKKKRLEFRQLNLMTRKNKIKQMTKYHEVIEIRGFKAKYQRKERKKECVCVCLTDLIKRVFRYSTFHRKRRNYKK